MMGDDIQAIKRLLGPEARLFMIRRMGPELDLTVSAKQVRYSQIPL